MRWECGRLWLLPVVALLLACLVVPGALAKPAEIKTVIGEITGTPMGTWVTLTSKSGTRTTSYQIDVSNAKITEKGKSLKRYQLVDKMKIRVKGSVSGSAMSAQSVEVLGRAPKKT